MKIEDMKSKAVSNAEVITAFIEGQPAHAENLSTDGETLRSYHYYEIALWTTKDVVTLRAGQLYSNTTQKHFNILKKALDKAKVEYALSDIETPYAEKTMKFTPSRADDVEQDDGARIDEDLPPAMFDRFYICEAHLAIEWDYHRGGILQERKSNKRRNMSTDFQLKRMGFKPRLLFRGYNSLTENGKAIYRNLEARYQFDKSTI